MRASEFLKEGGGWMNALAFQSQKPHTDDKKSKILQHIQTKYELTDADMKNSETVEFYMDVESDTRGKISARDAI